MKVCVILPTYNEAGNIEAIIKRLVIAVPEADILVVDDNSPDGTSDKVRILQENNPQLKLLVRMQNKGFAQSYLDGFRQALSRPELTHIVTMDADFSHDPFYLPGMLAKSEQFDVVIGSRYAPGGGVAGWEYWRMLLSAFANRYCRTITGIPLRDCTAGFSVIRLHSLLKLSLEEIHMSGYAFLMELKYLLWKRGALFTEVPIIFHNRAQGESKMSRHIIAEGVLAPWRLRGRA